MSKFYRTSTIILTASLLASCTAGGLVVQCTDSAIPRLTTEAIFDIKVFSTDGNLLSSNTIECKKYYNSQCSVRGNYYKYERSVTGNERFSTLLENGDKIEFSFPVCKTLMSNKYIEPHHFGRRYVDIKSGKRINKLIYVMKGTKGKGWKGKPEGYMYFNENREPTYLGVQLDPTISVIESKTY